MTWGSARTFFSSICSSDDREGLSRRDVLAGLGPGRTDRRSADAAVFDPGRSERSRAARSTSPDVPSDARRNRGSRG